MGKTNFEEFLYNLDLEYYARVVAEGKVCDLCVAKAYGGCYDRPNMTCLEKIIKCGKDV